jgi:predicted RNA binding protein YcfA (HicA-like mRNA interferase family)
MTKVPSLGYEKVIASLQRDGWVVVRQKGSHIRLQKHTLRQSLVKPGVKREAIRLIAASDSGVKPGVDLDNGRSLRGIMDNPA